MPYILQEKRNSNYDWLYGGPLPTTEDDLNYCITTLVHHFIKLNGGVSYVRLNSAIGVLECAKLELYRRIASPYEDLAIERNGDIEILSKKGE